MNFDQYFMTMVYLVASKSKDENTKIGAVIVDDNNVIISTGYNSFPMGINDNIPERQERPEKYYWMSHSEVNAIALAARKGHATEGCIMYTNGTPCTTCARTIINAGIKRVIVDLKWMDSCPKRWLDEAKMSEVMFKEAGIDLKFLVNSPSNVIRSKLDGKDYKI